MNKTLAMTTQTPVHFHIDTAIRFLHLIIALSFLGAYLSSGEEAWETFHMTCGYTLAIALGLRLIWQFVAPKVSQGQPFSPSKRFSIARNCSGLLWKETKNASNVPLWNKRNAQLAVSALLNFSILLILFAIPFTVLLGYFTESTGHSHLLKEFHELFANLFLVAVAVHLFSLLANSVLAGKWVAKKMLFGSVTGVFARSGFAALVMLLVFVAFWVWYLA